MKPCLLFLFLPALAIHAQSPVPASPPDALPVGPLLARAPDFSSWVTIFGNSSSKAGDSRSSSEKESRAMFIKTKSTYYEEYLNPAGKTWRAWGTSHFQAAIDPQGTVILGSVGDPRLVTDYSKTDFLGVDWISAQNFQKVQQYKGRKCLVFSVAGKVADPSANLLPYGRSGAKVEAVKMIDQTSIAVIDFDTRLPLYAQCGSVTYTYEYLTPPQALLQLPAGVVQAAQKVGIHL